jgi:hypothetical protein
VNTEWKKASRSATGTGTQCVEVRLYNGLPQVRDSKHTVDILELSDGDFAGLKRAARNGFSAK